MNIHMTVLALSFSFLISGATAQEPEAPIEAKINVSNSSPFIKEAFFITLTIITRGVEIRQQLDLANLPDAARIALSGSFEPLPIQREVDGSQTIETRRYRIRAYALTAGASSIAPLLRLTTQYRTRSLFGSMIQDRPVSLEIPPVTINAKSLPPPPVDFCGAVGALAVTMDVSPTHLVAGDLITVTTQISGEGWVENLVIPVVQEAPLLKTYAVKEVQHDPRHRRFTQTIIPKSDAVIEIPAMRITTFDTTKGQYITHSAGPFPLYYHEAKTRIVERFHPDGQTVSNGGSTNVDSSTARLQQRMAARGRVSATCTTESSLHLAPSLASLSTSTVPAGSTVQIGDRYGEWLIIQYGENRGWLHESALTRDRP